MKKAHDTDRTADLIARAMELESEDAKAAGAIGFVARGLVMATMPHRRLAGLQHVRQNGAHTLAMTAVQPGIGLPWGAMARLLTMWIVTEAKRTGSRELVLGSSLSEFLRKIGYGDQGGPRSPAARVRDQLERLLSCAIAAALVTETRSRREQFVLADVADLWWTPVRDRPEGAEERAVSWRSTMTLSERFYGEVRDHGVPVDLRVLHDQKIRQSPLAIDVYCWLTHRMYTLSRPTLVPWSALRMQFGSSYPDTPQGHRNFRRELLRRVDDVVTLYPAANVVHQPDGLELRPSPPHVPQTVPRRLR